MATEDQKVELKPEDVQHKGQETKKQEGKEEPLYADIGNMGKFLEEMKLGEEAAKKEAEPEKKPGTDGPDEESLSKFTKEDGTKAIDIIEIEGEDHPIYTREDYVTLANRTAKKEAEKKPDESIAQYEERLARVATPLNELVNLIKQGKPLPSTKKEEDEDEITDLDTLDDGVRNVFMKQKETIGSLKAELEGIKNVVAEQTDLTNRQNIEKTAKQMDEAFLEIKKEFPFDEIMAEDGTNITQNKYAGLVSVHANLDRMQAGKDSGYKPRDMRELMRQSASDMKAVEDYYRKKFSGSEDGGSPSGEITAEKLIKEFPDIANEIGKTAIVKYMKEAKEGNDPEVKSTQREASPKERKTGKDFKSLDEAFDAAGDDEEVVKGLEEIGKSSRFGLL